MDVSWPSVPLALVVGGLVFALGAVTGGGHSIGPLTLPKLPAGSRWTMGVLGLVLLASPLLLSAPDGKDVEDGEHPSGSPPASPSQSLSPPPAPEIRYSREFTIQYIDNDGHFDIDPPTAWNGDQTEQGGTDLALNAGRVASEHFAKIARSKSGGNTVCAAAISNEAPPVIGMGQVQDDKGFCAMSDQNVVAYVQFLGLEAADDDHSIRIRVTAYN